jgi:hypothetical protein
MKRSPINKVSKKMAHQKVQERKLTAQLVELSYGRCEICHQKGIFGLAKHEIIKRSHQGDECDPLNTLLLCGNCHNHAKYPKSGTPLSIEEQQSLAKLLHSCLINE